MDIVTDGYNAVEAKNYFETRGYNIESKQEKNQVATDASVVEEEKKTVMVLCIALQLNVTLFKYANEILAYRGKYS